MCAPLALGHSQIIFHISIMAAGTVQYICCIATVHLQFLECCLDNHEIAGARVQDIFGVLSNGQEWQIFRYTPGSSIVEYEQYELGGFPGEEPEIYDAQFETLMSALLGVVMHQLDADS